MWPVIFLFLSREPSASDQGDNIASCVPNAVDAEAGEYRSGPCSHIDCWEESCEQRLSTAASVTTKEVDTE